MGQVVGWLPKLAMMLAKAFKMPIKNPAVIEAAVPQNQMDQIVDIITGSFSVGAGVTDAFGFVTDTQASDQKDLFMNDLFLFKGLWSCDGGATWQEMGNTLVLGNQSGGLRELNVDCDISRDNLLSPNSTQIYITADNSGSSGFTIQYKILLMARYDQDHVPSRPLLQKLRYSSKNNYMKILADSSADLNTGGQTVIPHNLGYIPNINVWFMTHFLDSTDDFLQMDHGNHKVFVDTVNLYLPARPSASFYASQKAYYRIYLDK
jgi:hypothetical protein